MSQQTSYELLGVSEDASFEEIQAARGNLTKKYNGDQKKIQAIEIAYDAILMDRLRLRQQGKIKVPEDIRFPEKTVQQTAPNFPSISSPQGPQWLQKLIDTPSRGDVIWPTVIYVGLGGTIAFFAVYPSLLQLGLTFAVVISIYFLNRKENRFGRAVLITLMALICGLVIGGILSNFVNTDAIDLMAEQFIALVTLVFLWAVSCFFR